MEGRCWRDRAKEGRRPKVVEVGGNSRAHQGEVMVISDFYF